MSQLGGQHLSTPLSRLPEADELRVSTTRDLLDLGFGEALATVDAPSMTVVPQIKLPGHTEAFEGVARGTRPSSTY